MAPTLHYTVYDGIAPDREMDQVAALMAAADPEGSPPHLIISRLTGDAVAAGRDQLSDAPLRRLTGGRASRYGASQVSVCLVIPDLEAYGGVVETAKLMNRGVRGTLRGLAGLGLKAMYGGRDVVTVTRRPVALLSMDRAANGVCLFQAVIGLDALAEPGDGSNPAPLGRSASLAELVTDIDFDGLVASLLKGYGAATGRTLINHPGMADTEPVTVAGPDLQGLTWGPALTVPIGALQAGVALADGRITRVALAGDFVADGGAMAALDRALNGVTPEALKVGRAVDLVFSGNARHSILGVPALGKIQEAILAACQTG